MDCRHINCLFLILFAFLTWNVVTAQDYFRMGSNTNTGEAMQFLREYDREASLTCYRVTLAQWKFVTNITDNNRRKMAEELGISTKFEKLSWKKAAAFDASRLPDPQSRRQMAKIVQASRAALPDERFAELQQLIAEMKEIYNAAKICPFSQKHFGNTPQMLSRQPYDNVDQSFGQSAQNFAQSGLTYDQSNQNFGQNSQTFGQNSQSFGQNSQSFGQNNQNFGQSDQMTELPGYCDMQLDPEISRILAHSRIESELLYVWKSFRDQTGPKLKNRFMRYVQLANQAAVSTGFTDAGDQMRAAYEDPSFRASVEEIYNQITPLYKQLFTYVRRKLVQRYGERALRPDGPIPAHLLGNMWAQNWKSIMDLVMPFPQVPNIDITSEMLRQGFTPLRMFQMAEEFYTSMGLKPAPPEFWRGSMLARPSDRTVQCTASAWDFCNRVDYRIKQCTEVTMQDLISTHHEMAHIQYYLQYADQPQMFRDGANPAFHEAVANAATLSVYNLQHLQRVGLYNNRTHDPYQVSMNFLMTMALEKVAYLPFAFMVDQWRWTVFEDGVHSMNTRWWQMKLRYQGVVPPVPRSEGDFDPGAKYHVVSDQSPNRWTVFEDGVHSMNTRWWQMKLRYQGVVPPVPRSEGDFDPGAKYHVVSDQEYIKYFLATVLEFQIFEQLCLTSGHASHLHECDIYRSRDAGRLLSEIMQPGSSKTASEIIRTMTRGRNNRISPEALVKYFRPLELWLRVQNRDEPIIGWNSNYQDIGLFAPQRASSKTVEPFLGLCFLLASSMLWL